MSPKDIYTHMGLTMIFIKPAHTKADRFGFIHGVDGLASVNIPFFWEWNTGNAGI
jgi:hypothetical protein